MKKWIIAISIWAIGQPVFATDYLLQQPNDPNATGLWKGRRPVPGVDCPIGSRVCEWVVQKNDTYIAHYSIDENGNQQFSDEPPPVVIPPDAILPGDEKKLKRVKKSIDKKLRTLQLKGSKQ